MSTEPTEPPDDQADDRQGDDLATAPRDPSHPMPTAVSERHVAAPLGRVWEVIADRASRRDFLGGDLDVDLEPGSAGTFDGPDGTVPARVRDVRPGRHLRVDWGRDGRVSSVDVDLEPDAAGTRVTIRERLVVDRSTVVHAVSHRHVPTSTPRHGRQPLALAA